MVLPLGQDDAAALRAAGRIILYDGCAQRAFIACVRGRLAPRECQILELTAAGLIDKEIASKLGISIGTIRTYWERIKSKLNSRTRSSAAVAWTVQCVSAFSLTRQPAPPTRYSGSR